MHLIVRHYLCGNTRRTRCLHPLTHLTTALSRIQPERALATFTPNSIIAVVLHLLLMLVFPGRYPPADSWCRHRKVHKQVHDAHPLEKFGRVAERYPFVVQVHFADSR